MVISLATLFIIFAAVIGSGAMVGIFAYLLHRLRQIEGRTTGTGSAGRLADQLDRIQEELLAVQRDMAGLTERLDFTEKLLAGGGERSNDEPGAAIRRPPSQRSSPD